MNTANAVRLRPFEFKIFGMYIGSEDRRGQDYNPGLYFTFQTSCSVVEFSVTKEMFDNPPSFGESLWIVGNIFLSKYSALELKPSKIYPPTEQDPEPTLEDNLEGGFFHGIGIVEKSTFRRNTGETGYKHLVRGLGLLYQCIFDSEEEYKKFPASEPIILSGRIKSELTYKGERHRVIYTLLFDEYRRVRRDAPPVTSPDADNSKASAPRRQAPQDK